MNDHYLRCVETDRTTLVQLGVVLGALAIDPDTGTVSAPGGAWDEIGHKPDWQTGLPICDPHGVPYWHANLRTPVDLRAVATALAPTHLAIAAGLAVEGRYFVVDAAGAAVPPAYPARVFL